MKRIAIIEDDHAIRENYMDLMQRYGYQVEGYSGREQAMQAFNSRLPDLAVIDVGLGHEYDGGFLLCQQLRQLSASLPIIFLTARDNDFDSISGLRLGADDYLSKEIGLEHLMVRISALFRRIGLSESNAQSQHNILQRGALTIDNDKMQISWEGNNLEVTITEFWIIHALAHKSGVVKSRQQLMTDANMVVDDNTITSHIKRIRKKFMQIDPLFDEITAIYGMGYRWDVSSETGTQHTAQSSLCN